MIATLAADRPLKNNKDQVLLETKALMQIDGLTSSSCRAQDGVCVWVLEFGSEAAECITEVWNVSLKSFVVLNPKGCVSVWGAELYLTKIALRKILNTEYWQVFFESQIHWLK